MYSEPLMLTVTGLLTFGNSSVPCPSPHVANWNRSSNGPFPCMILTATVTSRDKRCSKLLRYVLQLYAFKFLFSQGDFTCVKYAHIFRCVNLFLFSLSFSWVDIFFLTSDYFTFALISVLNRKWFLGCPLNLGL